MNWKTVAFIVSLVVGAPGVVTGYGVIAAGVIFFEDLKALVETYRDPETQDAWRAWVRHHKAGTIEKLWEAIENK